MELMGRISSVYGLNEFTWMSNSRRDKMLNDMNELESELQNKITEIDEDNEKLTDMHNREIQEREQRNQEEVRQMNIQLAMKMDEEGAKQKSLELECKEVKNRLREVIAEKEEAHRNKLLALYREKEEIEKDVQNYRDQKDGDIMQSNHRFNNILETLRSEFDKNKGVVNSQYKQAILYLKEDQKKFQEALRQTEDEYNQLIENTEKELSDKLRDRKKTTEQIRSNYFKLVKTNQKNKERADNLDKLIEETKTQNNQLQTDIDSFKDKYREMESRLNQQESVINLKESKIKEYRNKNYHLQNFKSVYDYQVSTLKEAHEPLTDYVKNLEQHIKTMYNELLSEAEASKQLEESIKKLDGSITSMKKKVKDDTTVFRETKRQFDVMEHGLVQTTTMQDNDQYKNRLKEVLETGVGYVGKIEQQLTLNGSIFTATAGENGGAQSLEKMSAVELESIRKELTRQRDTLSKKLIRNTEINARLEKERENVFKQIQDEGETLISKCNSLRRNGLVLRFQIGLKEKEAKDLQYEQQTIEEETIGKQPPLINNQTPVGTLKQPVFASESKLPKHKTTLPYIDYKKRAAALKPTIVQVEPEREMIQPTQLVTRLVKKFEQQDRLDKLKEEAENNGLDLDQYESRLNNFKSGSKGAN